MRIFNISINMQSKRKIITSKTTMNYLGMVRKRKGRHDFDIAHKLRQNSRSEVILDNLGQEMGIRRRHWLIICRYVKRGFYNNYTYTPKSHYVYLNPSYNLKFYTWYFFIESSFESARECNLDFQHNYNSCTYNTSISAISTHTSGY